MAVQYAFGKIVTQGLDLNVDAADPTSYPGTGTTWTSVVNRSITGSLVSCSFSPDFKGGIVFNNPSASVQFPGSVANYGTGSFTIEMAFRPSSINGIHYLVSKNSGSFPNWGVYLSGSGGSGKLFAEYRINASVSCSVSSSTVFVTGSNYDTSILINPTSTSSLLIINGTQNPRGTGNGSGALITTSSLYLGNTNITSSQSFFGSLYFLKVYEDISFAQPYVNYNCVSARLNTSLVRFAPPSFRTLIVAGGGSGGAGSGGGGGGGGQVIETLEPFKPGIIYTVAIGSSNQNSSITFPSNTFYVAERGGSGGSGFTPGNNGGNGGGAGGNDSQGSLTPGTGSLEGYSGGIAVAANLGGGGGGAGAGGNGGNAGGNLAGKGGIGYYSDITGVGSYYGGGGSGGNRATTVAPNLGGGGIGGSNAPGQAGTANTGGGGGGGGGGAGGGIGGSGIVVIRYKSTSQIATGGQIIQLPDEYIHIFTSSGQFIT